MSSLKAKDVFSLGSVLDSVAKSSVTEADTRERLPQEQQQEQQQGQQGENIAETALERLVGASSPCCSP